MLVYPSFIYLQNQKTGSTFVELWLRKFCSEPLLKYKKHATLTYFPKKLCFMNIREPVSLYRSLFSYGLDGRGAVYNRLKHHGYSYLYENGPAGFNQFLNFINSPSHSVLLHNKYTPNIAQLVGFMSWRFLCLSCVNFQEVAPIFQNKNDLNIYLKNHYVVNKVLRQENLRVDLINLSRNQLAEYIKNKEDSEYWLTHAQKANVSLSKKSDIMILDEVLSDLKKKEFFLYENFYSS